MFVFVFAHAVWRILVGLSLIPAFGTLYQRLTLPESTRYAEARKAAQRVQDEESIEELKKKANADPGVSEKIQPVPSSSDEGAGTRTPSSAATTTTESSNPPKAAAHAKANAKEHAHAQTGHFRDFFAYFSEWRHLRVLVGTCACWFLLDVAFYGINLNQNVVLQQIGFDGAEGSPWNRLFKIGIGNLIVTALGFVPGYYVAILTIEKLGRKWIQIQGFLFAALFRECPLALFSHLSLVGGVWLTDCMRACIIVGILAGNFHKLSTPAFIVCFAFLQFFFNFGANTYVPSLPLALCSPPSAPCANPRRVAATAGRRTATPRRSSPPASARPHTACPPRAARPARSSPRSRSTACPRTSARPPCSGVRTTSFLHLPICVSPSPRLLVPSCCFLLVVVVRDGRVC